MAPRSIQTAADTSKPKTFSWNAVTRGTLTTIMAKLKKETVSTTQLAMARAASSLSPQELEKLTADIIRAALTDAGVAPPSKAKKADLVAILLQHQQTTPAEDSSEDDAPPPIPRTKKRAHPSSSSAGACVPTEEPNPRKRPKNRASNSSTATAYNQVSRISNKSTVSTLVGDASAAAEPGPVDAPVVVASLPNVGLSSQISTIASPSLTTDLGQLSQVEPSSQTSVIEPNSQTSMLEPNSQPSQAEPNSQSSQQGPSTQESQREPDSQATLSDESQMGSAAGTTATSGAQAGPSSQPAPGGTAPVRMTWDLCCLCLRSGVNGFAWHGEQMCLSCEKKYKKGMMEQDAKELFLLQDEHLSDLPSTKVKIQVKSKTKTAKKYSLEVLYGATTVEGRTSLHELVRLRYRKVKPGQDPPVDRLFETPQIAR